MKDSMATIGAIMLGIALVIGGIYGYIQLYRDAAPRYQEAEREVFVNTASYINGKTDELNRMRRQYETATDPAAKKAIREEALTSAGTVDNNKLPADLRGWIKKLKANPVIIQTKETS